MARVLTEEEKQYAQELVQRARCAMRAVESYDQETIDRLCRAVAWATANEQTATRLAYMGVDESGLGDREGRPNKRFKILSAVSFCLALFFGAVSYIFKSPIDAVYGTFTLMFAYCSIITAWLARANPPSSSSPMLLFVLLIWC